MANNKTQNKPKDKAVAEKPNAVLPTDGNKKTGYRVPNGLRRGLNIAGRVLLEAGSAALTLSIIWFSVLTALMTRPSIDLEIFKPHYENWFKTAFSGKTTEIETYAARWNNERQTVEITASNIVIGGSDGQSQTIGTVKGEFEFGVNLLSTPELTRLTIDGGALTVKRLDTGVLLAGLGTPDTFEKVGPLWSSAEQDETAGQNLSGMIEQVEVSSAKIYWRDDLFGQNVMFDQVNGLYSSNGTVIDMTSHGLLVASGIQSPVSFNLSSNQNFDDYSAELSLKNFRPNMVSPAGGQFEVLSNLDAPVDVLMGIIVRPDTGLQDFRFELDARAGRLKTGTSYKAFESAEITAVYNAPKRHIELTNFTVKSHALSTSVSGSLQGLGGQQAELSQTPISFDLITSDMLINPGKQYDGPIAIKSGALIGKFAPHERTLYFDTLGLDFGSFQIAFEGLARRDEVGRFTALDIDGGVMGIMDIKQILSLWPHNFAPNTRKWTVNTVKTGQFSNIKIHTAFNEDDFKGRGRPNDHMNVTYDVNNADIQFLRQMPLLKDMVGRAVLQGNQSDFYIDSGYIDGIQINAGSVHVPQLYPFGQDFTVDVQGQGEIAELLRLSDFPPLELATKFKISPDIFAGNGNFGLKITRPLSLNLNMNAIRYEMNGQFEHVEFPLGLGGQKISDGQLTLLGNNKGIQVDGPVKIGRWQANLNWQKQFEAEPIPAQYSLKGVITRDDLDEYGIGLRRHLGGDIDLTLSGESDGLTVNAIDLLADFTKADVNMGRMWNKPAGEFGQLKGRVSLGTQGGSRMENISVTADGLSINGAISLAENFKLQKINLDQVVIDGLIDARIQAQPTKDGVLSITVAGAYLNAETWVSQAFKTQSSAVSAPMLMTGSIDKLLLDENYVLANAQGIFVHNGQDVTQARLQGVREKGPFLAEIITETDTNGRVFHVEIPDASIAALTLLGLDAITGGSLKMDGRLPPSGASGAISGSVELQNFTLVRAPAFAQVLSLASLTGLADTLGGSGLSFNSLDLAFSLEKGNLKIRDGRASGPALGVTADGDLNINEKILDFNGVVVPSYTVNSILGDIPLLGDVMVGKKGEGIFALNYTVKGPYSATQVVVNPLSALTPGFMRRIFDVKREKITDPVIKDMIEEQKIK